MKQRFEPFLVLLEARYAPLLFAVAPQAYAVYLWLFPQPYDAWGEAFAVAGAVGYEFVYVGAIAWAEEGRSSVWTWATAVVALLFSVVVAFYVYRAQGAWAWLHAGFPLVAFTYTLNMYSKRSIAAPVESAQTPLEALPKRPRSTEAPESDTASSPATSQAFLDELLAVPLATTQAAEEKPSDTERVLEIPMFDRLEDFQQDLVRRMAGAEHPGVPLEQITVVENPRYFCPHCDRPLKSKQARGAAAANGYCPDCKAERKALVTT